MSSSKLIWLFGTLDEGDGMEMKDFSRDAIWGFFLEICRKNTGNRGQPWPMPSTTWHKSLIGLSTCFVLIEVRRCAWTKISLVLIFLFTWPYLSCKTLSIVFLMATKRWTEVCVNNPIVISQKGHEFELNSIPCYTQTPEHKISLKLTAC